MITARRSRRSTWLVAVAIIAAVSLGMVVALLLSRRTFAPGARVIVDNQTSYATQIGITDSDIGCVDSKLVGPHVSDSVDLSLGGSPSDTMFGLLCLGESINSVGFSNSVGEWACLWNQTLSRRIITIREEGPDCELIRKRILPTSSVP